MKAARPVAEKAVRPLRPGARPLRRTFGRAPAWAPPLSLLLHGAQALSLIHI